MLLKYEGAEEALHARIRREYGEEQERFPGGSSADPSLYLAEPAEAPKSCLRRGEQAWAFDPGFGVETKRGEDRKRENTRSISRSGSKGARIAGQTRSRQEGVRTAQDEGDVRTMYHEAGRLRRVWTRSGEDT